MASSKKKTIQKLAGPPQLQKSSLDPKHPSHKFLLRTFTISNKDDAAYRFVRVKKFYLKRLVVDFLNLELYKTDYALVSGILKNNKILKTLKHAHITSDLKPHVHESLKHSRNLKKYNIGFKTDDDETNKIYAYLKNLSLQVEMIRINIFRLSPNDKNNDLYNNAKALRRFRRLKYFNRWYFSSTFDPDLGVPERSHVANELQTLSDSASRLKGLRKLTYHTNYSEQRGLQRTMRRGFIYPGITGLRIDLDAPQFTHFDYMQDFFIEEREVERDSQILYYSHLNLENMSYHNKRLYQFVVERLRKEDLSMKDDLKKMPKYIKEEDDRIDFITAPQEIVNRYDEIFTVECRMKEEIKPFYRYELFPDLKKLSFKQRTFLYPLGSFVVDGFKALTKLESFKFKIANRSIGTSYIFEGLKHLPLLKKFSFSINFLKDNEWTLLEDFLENQINLECLSLTVKADYFIKERFLKQNVALEKILQGLNNKPHLKILELRSPYWSLQSLSNGLSCVTLPNQIKSFEFQGSDDLIDSGERVWKRIQGLCQFIKNQKESLKEVSFEFGVVLEDNIVNHIMEALTKLVNLKYLHLDLNSGFVHVGEVLVSYFKMAHSNNKKLVAIDKSTIPENWSPSLAKYLKRLQNLENLRLNLGIINPNKQDAGKWIVEAVKTLPSLERLKYLDINVDENIILKREEPKIIAALRELKNIKEMRVDLYGGGYAEHLYDKRDIKNAILEINKKQAVRSDLMF